MTESVSLKTLSVHKVGNKTHDESHFFSEQPLPLTPELEDTLTTYFLTPFKQEAYFSLHHDTDLQLNEVFHYVAKVFENPECLHEQSINLAKHLYQQSVHPNVKSGEFYVAYFKNGNLKGENVDIIGLFKSENKDTFLKISHGMENLGLEIEEGININKLDKGCLIYNTNPQDGYIVAIVDQTNKSREAQYWTDDFLGAIQLKDAYFNTQSTLSLYKNFVTNRLSDEFEVSRADQAELLNKSMAYFKEHENFELNDFSQAVLHQPELIDSFNSYKQFTEREQGVEIAESFEISDSAVKKQSRNYKSIIKLDKNFHIYIHGNRNLIEQGIDDNGKKFYKIFYENET